MCVCATRVPYLLAVAHMIQWLVPVFVAETRLSEALNQLLQKIIHCFETSKASPLLTSAGQMHENMMEEPNKW